MPLCNFVHDNCAQWTAGASRHPVFPAPSFIGGEATKQSSGEISRESAKVCLRLRTRCHRPRRRAIQYSRDACDRAEKPRRTGFPAFAGNDSGTWRTKVSPPHHVIASAAKQSRIPPRKDSGLLRCARNDDVEQMCAKTQVSCPGRCAALLQRCAAEPGAMLQRVRWPAGSRLCAAA